MRADSSRGGNHAGRPRGAGRSALGSTLVAGLLAGAAGVAAMTAAEKLEQAVTGRPDSYVPAHTLERLLGLRPRPDRGRLGLNWAMHWGKASCLAWRARPWPAAAWAGLSAPSCS
jgi:hypothetical protein